ncbi:MAG: STM4013/SEN3800 family hydrolase [Pseudomonadota bacterium]
MINMNAIVGSHDIVFMTLDTLRYDVAYQELAAGNLPNLARLIPSWQKRHSPGSFTYAAHQAFFAGFLPTPAQPGSHSRLFALAFPGSETTVDTTCVFDTPDIVTGLAARGYYTVCIGGVGFFNKLTPLGSVLPNLFQHSHWQANFGVTCRESSLHQIQYALKIIRSLKSSQRLFLFINVSALHQPNYFYLPSTKPSDSIASHAAALRYVDTQLPALLSEMQNRASVFGIICSDHGTAYGEDNYYGHRLAHEVVLTVPYAEFIL